MPTQYPIPANYIQHTTKPSPQWPHSRVKEEKRREKRVFFASSFFGSLYHRSKARVSTSDRWSDNSSDQAYTYDAGAFIGVRMSNTAIFFGSKMVPCLKLVMVLALYWALAAAMDGWL